MTVILILVCFLTGCGNPVPQSESYEDTDTIQTESQNETATVSYVETEEGESSESERLEKTFIWKWETQRWLDWGKFHFFNGEDDPTLYELSDRYKGRECVTNDPEVFLFYIHQQFTDDAEHYPFFLLLDSEGAVQYIIDAAFV